jgi:hypothetical protein
VASNSAARITDGRFGDSSVTTALTSIGNRRPSAHTTSTAISRARRCIRSSGA